MEALNIISAEHRGMWRLATALDSIAQEIGKSGQAGSAASAEVAAMMLEYLSSYIDRMHHPKEDEFLFRLLRLRDPDAGADI
ncbi:MAG TPA: hemerythrin domain-containing protein, partial [Noviherbaspirillum sp.]